MINLTLDNIIYDLQKFGGASVYWNNIKKHYYKSHNLNIIELNRTGTFSRVCPVYSKRTDIFHSSYFTTSISGKNILTIHDLSYEKGMLPKLNTFFGLLERKLAIKNADGLIFISNYTKNDFFKYYDFDESKTTVIHHGTNFNSILKYTIEFNFDKLKKWLIYVGGRSHYKNFNILLFAISQLKKNGVDCGVICTGSKFSNDELKELEKLKIRENFFDIGFISDESLKYLYERVDALIYTSNNEGFGLPALDAMVSDCNVIAPNNSVFLEILGSYGNYFELNNGQNLAKVITEVIYSEKSIIEKEYNNLDNFSWSKCASQHIDFYQKILSKG